MSFATKVAVASLLSPSIFTQGFKPQELNAINTAVDGLMKAYNFPGMSIAITKDGRLVYAKGFGIARRLSLWERIGVWIRRAVVIIDAAFGGVISTRRIYPLSRPQPDPKVTPWHLFRVASVSKVITAVAVMKLIEQKKLTLGHKVFGRGALLETYFDLSTLPPGQNTSWLGQITVDHFLEHTCGGWGNDPKEPYRDPTLVHTDLDNRQLISWVVRNRPLDNEPGTSAKYSNFGYFLLGRIIEQVTGQPYANYVKEQILSLCDIDDMHIAGATRSDRRSNEVAYYGQGFFSPGPWSPYLPEDPYAEPLSRGDSAGGWIASAVDLVRFSVRVDGFRKPSLFGLRDDILSSESIRAMTTPSPVSAALNFAKGWQVNTATNNWWKPGGMPGTTAYLLRTSTGLCWAILANSWQRFPNKDIVDAIEAMITGISGAVTVWPTHDLFSLYDDPWPSIHLNYSRNG
jgi:CubicO group peptidase (beta-lactamase class C family)